MKSQAKYVALLERELEYVRGLLEHARKDVEFYRGKVERLELSLMSNAGAAAQVDYVARTETQQKDPVAKLREVKQMPSGRLPFHEIKRRWNAMSAEEQQKAIDEGWELDGKPKEETNAGS